MCKVSHPFMYLYFVNLSGINLKKLVNHSMYIKLFVHGMSQKCETILIRLFKSHICLKYGMKVKEGIVLGFRRENQMSYILDGRTPKITTNISSFNR